MIICLGDGSSISDIAAQEIAKNRSMRYLGILDSHTTCEDGVYHTSKYDIKPQQLLEIINDSTEFVILDNADIELIAVTGQNPVLQYLETNKSFCALAFTSVLQDHNQYRFCCYQHKPVTVTDTFDFSSNSEMNSIRQRMINNQSVDHCKYCMDAEEESRAPIRKIKTREIIDLLGFTSVQDIIEFSQPVDYDIIVGNQCNAMCRMCHPDDSHLIDKEYYKLGITKKQLGIVASTTFDIVDIHTAKKVYVAGGEPTVSQEFISFLEKCIEEKCTDFYLQINTNAFVLSSKFIKLIEKFTQVQFIVSVDGYQDALYYIRYPINWDKLTKNIKQLNALGDICFNHTISIYNVGRMYDLFNFFSREYPTKTSLICYADQPTQLWFGNHPNKYQVLQEIEKCKTLQSYKTNTNFHNDINHIEQTILTHTLDHELLDKFYAFNDLLDMSRNLKLADYMPELVIGNIK